MNSPALPLGTHPNAAAPVILCQDAVSAESSFLAQRDPGPKPHSWWGLECHRVQNFLLTSPLASSPRTQAGLSAVPTTNTLRQVCVCPPQGSGPPWTLSSRSKRTSHRREATVPAGREGRGRAQGGAQRGTEELLAKIPACPLVEPPVNVGPAAS